MTPLRSALWLAILVLVVACRGEERRTIDVRVSDASDLADVDRDAHAEVSDTGADPDARDVHPADLGTDPLQDGALTDAVRELDANGRTFDGPQPWLPSLGARFQPDGTGVRIAAPNAIRVEVWFYDAALEAPEIARLVLEPDGEGVWEGILADEWPPFYGLRVWGPNWEYHEEWVPGSELGLVSDVDGAGNRFNPNKLLLDPYALGMSHDPIHPGWQDSSVYRSGPDARARDSAPVAPKGEIVWFAMDERPARPERPLRDDVIYEVHLRGLTMNDPTVPVALRGTYAGAALRARYLAELGVSAVEFLPLHETQNDQNDLEEGTAGDNYWGYASLSFFAPDRRYSSDQSHGAPLREFIRMVDAFHAEGIKVFVDVVYNHTGEGSAWNEGQVAPLLSWRGVDNSVWYQTVDGNAYRSDNGVGPNLRFTNPVVQEAVLDSLRFYSDVVGVDGFRFDLAALLGNECEGDCFEFVPHGLLAEISSRFARDDEGGVDLIAEPWGTTSGTYMAGEFPEGWHEWNDQYRMFVRASLNEPWAAPTPDEIVTKQVRGFREIYRGRGRGPAAAIGYVASHDGLAWGDIFRCSEPNNDQPWPYGPSDGGSARNQSSDYGGDPAAQRQAARTAFALMVVSPGVPMFTGGDEFMRTQRCNNNPYNLDSVGVWLDWDSAEEHAAHTLFVRRMLEFRRAQPGLRPQTWELEADPDADGLPRFSFYDADASFPSRDYWESSESPMFGWRMDGDESGSGDPSVYVAWNRSADTVRVTLPETPADTDWYRVADTAAWLEADANSHPLGSEPQMGGAHYDMHPQSILILVER